jgi:tetratricopeptide (TPR) repeat protein
MQAASLVLKLNDTVKALFGNSGKDKIVAEPIQNKPYPHPVNRVELVFPALLLLLIPLLAVSSTLSSPKTAEAFHQKGRAFYQQHSYALAIAQYSKAIALDPANYMYYNSRANAYYFKADHALSESERINALESAMADYTQAIQYNSRNAHGYRYRGEVKLQLGELQSGLQDLHQAAWVYQSIGNESNYRSVIYRLSQLK